MSFEFFAHASRIMLMAWALRYLIACLISWYLLAGFSYAMNGGKLGRHWLWFPFQCFAEEVPCYWFGGRSHRIEFIKSRNHGDGVFCGSRHSYTHQEIRENNLYETVFWEMCGGRRAFWGGQLFQFFFGPPLVLLFLEMVLISVVFLLPLRWLWELITKAAKL